MSTQVDIDAIRRVLRYSTVSDVGTLLPHARQRGSGGERGGWGWGAVEGGGREVEESTLRAPLSCKLKEGCRKPVLGVCSTASHVGTLLPSARQHGSGGEVEEGGVDWGVGG